MRSRIKRRFRLNLRITSAQKIYLILVVSVYFGVILGSLFVSTDKIGNILIGYAQSLCFSPLPSTVLLNDFLINFLFFCAMFLLGMSVYGYIFIPILPFIKGFSYGFTAAFYFQVFGSKGILVCAMGVLPQMLICCVCLIFGAHAAFTKSLSFQKREYARSIQNHDLRRYSLCFIVLFMVSYLTVLLDIFLIGNVIKLFC